MLLETIESGKALDKLATFIESQGGNKEDVYNTENLFRATICYELLSETDGYVKGSECEGVGMASLLLGGGRRSKTDEIDLWTGIILNKKVGDKVEKGECIAKLYANDNAKLEQAKTRLFDAYSFSSDPVNKNVLIKEIIK